MVDLRHVAAGLGIYLPVGLSHISGRLWRRVLGGDPKGLLTPSFVSHLLCSALCGNTLFNIWLAIDPATGRSLVDGGKLSVEDVLPAWVWPRVLLERVAIAVGVGIFVFVAVGLFAWWRNRAHTRQTEQSLGGVVDKDVLAIRTMLHEDATTQDVLRALILCPALRRNLHTMRREWMARTVKASGKELAGMLQLQREAEDAESYALMRRELENLGAYPVHWLDVPATLSDEDKQVQECVTLIILSRLRSRVYGEAELQARLSDTAKRERAVVIRVGAKLLDAVLVHVCLRQRWLQASYSTIELTAQYSSGLWSSEPECVALVRAGLEKSGAKVPRLELTATITTEALDGSCVEAAELECANKPPHSPLFSLPRPSGPGSGPVSGSGCAAAAPSRLAARAMHLR